MASALCWLWGVLFFAIYFLVFLDDSRAGRPTTYLIPRAIVALLITAAYCFAGYTLAKGRVIGAVTAIVISALTAVLVASPPEPAGIAIAILNITIIALVVFGWRHFRKPRSNGVGA